MQFQLYLKYIYNADTNIGINKVYYDVLACTSLEMASEIGSILVTTKFFGEIES